MRDIVVLVIVEIRRRVRRVLLLITIPTAAQTPTPVPMARYAVYRTARTSIQAVGAGTGCVVRGRAGRRRRLVPARPHVARPTGRAVSTA
jgi:hypothetical protein